MRSAPILLFALALVAGAQTPLGTVTGLATDPSGGAVPGVAITLTSQETAIKRSVSTNGSGVYSLPDLPPGTYRLNAEAKGFRPMETRAFSVEAFRTVRQDLPLELATASSEVVVTEAASAMIQLESPAISAGLASRQIIELPTNLRSVAKNSGDSGLISEIMPETVPGVVQVGGGAKWLSPGGTAGGTKVKVDGIETMFGNFGSPDNVSQPSVEAIQEFTANVLTSRAEFSGMGTVTTATKSGTNEFHGGLYEYMHNSATDARNTFTTAKPFTNLHNYGGTLGGPLQKDKTFFFADFDGTRGVAAYLFSPNVPTVAMRGGDFTGQAALKNPFTTSPYSGNTILPQFLSSQALKAQQLFFPLPNFGPANLTAANYRAAFDGPEVHRTEEFKVDHNFSANHMAFLRYSNRKDDYHIPGARSALPPTTVGTSDNIRRVNFWTLGDVATLKSNMVNEFRAGVVILVSASSSDFTGQNVMQQLGIAGLPDRGPVNSLPFFSISGYSNNNINLLSPVNDGHAQLADNLSWVHGRHSMKFGVEEINWFVNRYMPNNSGNPIFGSYSFTGAFTGNAYADFLLGVPATVTREEPFATQYNRSRDWAGYAQDDFRITPRLTLIYGLRYEYNGPAYARDGNMYSFDLATGKIVLPGQQSLGYVSKLFPSTYPVETADAAGLGRSLRKSDANNFAPRFGFSYQLDHFSRTVLRGGWGVYYNHYSENVPGDLAAGPFSATTVNTNTFTNGQPLFTLANPFAAAGTPGTLSLRAVAPNLRNSYVQQYTLSLEHELTRDMGVRVSYIGSKGSQLVYRRDVNQPLASTVAFNNNRRPYPIFGTINYADNGGNMLYSGLQTQVQRRFSRGLLFSSTWTWAKEISDADEIDDFELGYTIEDTYNRRRDRGNVYSVPRHQWINQALYDLPLGKGKLLSGWQINTLLNFSTGNWYTPVISGPDPTNTRQTTLRPDLITSTIAMPKTLNQWFDPSAFGTPANGLWGNAGRGIIEGPGYVLCNFSLQKTVRIEKWGALQFVASFQNVLNHVNYGEPTGGGSPLQSQTTVNNSNAGKITSTAVFPPAGSPRIGQLAIRWNF
ncbi:MAG TPA: TonB-dependent receptor [Candidatus Sulfopaludibacter sp.]|nr:TonB-dependent receptor [Candidatus Sulfopaludibacter sp.]